MWCVCHTVTVTGTHQLWALLRFQPLLGKQGSSCFSTLEFSSSPGWADGELGWICVPGQL